MITKNTVFVLGAGASCPYGFPSGSDLRKQILSDHVSDCSAYLETKEAARGMIPQALRKAERFADAFRKSTQSIDRFLVLNPKFREAGKRAIVFRILAAERQSRFREESKHENQDWYKWLFGCLTDEFVKREDYTRFCENNVSFVTFNYDRSLEHFLYDSLLHSFVGVERAKILEQLDQIRIIHVFGRVAPLDWQGHGGVRYRADNKSISVDSLSRNLRTIYEEMENPELKEAQDLIRKADKIFFLGFGYAKENLDVLGIPKILSRNQLVYGTALGLTKRQRDKVLSVLKWKNGSQCGVTSPRIEDSDSLALLHVCL